MRASVETQRFFQELITATRSNLIDLETHWRVQSVERIHPMSENFIIIRQLLIYYCRDRSATLVVARVFYPDSCLALPPTRRTLLLSAWENLIGCLYLWYFDGKMTHRRKNRSTRSTDRNAYIHLWLISSVFVSLCDQSSFDRSSAMTLNSTSNTTGTSTTTMLSKPLFIQGQEIIQRSFNRLDRVTWTRLSVVFVSLLCLLLMFIGLKSFA